VMVANPVMVILMIGGGHNDLLVIGLLAAGAVVALRGVEFAGRDAGPAFGIALVTMSMAVKASAGAALPFLVLVWAMQMHGTQFVRIMKAIGAGVVVFGVTFAACTLAAGVNLGWLPALSAPSMIVNWMSLPTGAGELIHSIVSIFATVPKQPFVNVMRAIGALLFLWLAVRHWLAARDAGPDIIRRAGVVLLLVAILSPALLPWYVTWGVTLLAATALSLRWLQLVAFVSPLLVIFYYPAGEDALYNPPYLLLCAMFALLAAVSLTRKDPLRLATGARSKAPVQDQAAAQDEAAQDKAAQDKAAPTLTAVPSPDEPTLAAAVPVEKPAGPAPAGAQQHAG
jgi:alpha-1,6-mannosyltransferase